MDQIFRTKLRNQLQNKLIKAKLAREEEIAYLKANGVDYSKEPDYLPPIMDYYQKDKLSDTDIVKIQNRNKKLRQTLKNR